VELDFHRCKDRANRPEIPILLGFMFFITFVGRIVIRFKTTSTSNKVQYQIELVLLFQIFLEHGNLVVVNFKGISCCEDGKFLVNNQSTLMKGL